jgi:hypothetical protein
VERGVTAVHHFADHFVTHDQRMADGDCAFVDVEIGAADAAMRDPYENLIVSESGPLDFGKAQVAGPSQDHGFHEGAFVKRRCPDPETLSTEPTRGMSTVL